MRRPVAALLTALLLAGSAACTDSDYGGGGEPDNTTTTTVPAIQELAAEEDLYALADDLQPGEPGDVIAVQDVEGLDVDGTVLRVLYHSESIEGDDIAVSGIITVPSGDVPDGGRPVLTWAHGTTGIADECAPGKDPEANGIGLAGPFLERGMVFAATDYEGLGTPGRHPYIVGRARRAAPSTSCEPPGSWRTVRGRPTGSWCGATRRVATPPCSPTRSPRSGHPSSMWWAPWRERRRPSCR